ncbi:hypothetical protein LINPERHAP1_LOCUS210 [Linum perenne]
MFCSSPIALEARALLEAVSFAGSTPAHCIVFSDCLTLVNCLQRPPSFWPWECYGVLACIQSLLRSSPSTIVRFTPRKYNKMADWVARTTRTSCLPPNWLSYLCNFPTAPC